MSNLREVATAPLSGFRHKEITVPEWKGAKVVMREPSAAAWIRWREVLKIEGEEGEENAALSAEEQAARNLNADVTLFIDSFCDTNNQPVFTPNDHDEVANIYGPVHSRLLKQALDLISTPEETQKK
ncbi:phage tail protein [Salmonella enterica]|uniref:phage tail assembly chaperone n=1 Tax=Salmonella enterica TaxID=28901 RepID=UPI0009B0A077|nr:phage tail assembly chaperone [Salmonella enterica]EBG8067289.1 phage tail protein [Salmonella enterica subsp. enterica serovar Elisabethville]EBW3368482.1 phage tail protein [Salmonella enterica subsp. enterica serovar Wangata]ECE5861202.1 phage tail protein [Salmonella enterica subsp. enterica]ECF4097074.1 phage tail protein [Salmonella enterica subsp. enterica serovar Adelaide]EBH6156916.1 phage tail protein [Salmonella enterica]